VREYLVTKSDAPVLFPLQVIGDQSASVASRPDRAGMPPLAHRASDPCRGEVEITPVNGTTIRAIQNISLASLHRIVTHCVDDRAAAVRGSCFARRQRDRHAPRDERLGTPSTTYPSGEDRLAVIGGTGRSWVHENRR
jgi:hypothetical protein